MDQIEPHRNALVTVQISGTFVTQIDLVNHPLPGQAQNYILKCVSRQREGVSDEWEVPIAPSVVDRLFQRVDEARIPLRGDSGLGVDGTSYAVVFGHPYGSRFSWWLSAPEGWDVLADIVGTLRSYSGRYLG